MHFTLQHVDLTHYYNPHSSVQKRKHRNLVTSCTSYLARTQGSEELYASIRPDPAVRRFRTAEGCTRILQWLNVSTVPFLERSQR